MERAHGLEIPHTLEELCAPRRLAVVVSDIQVGVLSQVERAAEVIEQVDEVTPWFLRDSPGFELVPEMAPRPSEAVFDKITMSAFEGTPLDIILRDCGLVSFAIVGVATEIGIEPTVRHGADLGYIPVVVTDACGAGDHEAAKRSIDGLAFSGDAVLTDTATLTALLRRHQPEASPG